MDKINKVIIVLGITFLLLVATLVSLSAHSYLTKKPNYHSWTKAICEKGICQDYELSCRNDSLLSMTLVGGAVLKINENWQDPRTLEDQNRICE